jgi:hypothetical protein
MLFLVTRRRLRKRGLLPFRPQEKQECISRARSDAISLRKVKYSMIETLALKSAGEIRPGY